MKPPVVEKFSKAKIEERNEEMKKSFEEEEAKINAIEEEYSNVFVEEESPNFGEPTETMMKIILKSRSNN